MDGSTWLYFLLGGVVAVVILGVVVADLIRKKDFIDQVSGKKPERINSKKKISYDALVQEDPQVTMEREVLRSRSAQYVLGPK